MRKKWKNTRLSKMTLRLIAAAFLVFCLAAAGFYISGIHENFYAEEVVTRGVIDKIEQIPKTKKDIYLNNTENTKKTLGQESNPFLVLEIVPDEAFAEFGYHVSGCEPVDVDDMPESEMQGLSQTLSNTFTKTIQDDSKVVYKNNGNFLRDTMGLSEEEAEKYCIVVKTITPKELNAAPEWADYADLYIVSTKSHVEKLPEWWDKYTRFTDKRVKEGESRTHNVKSFVNKDSEKDRDISWQVVMKMYHRISAYKNFAALIMETCAYDMTQDALKDSVKQGSDFDIYDWNWKKINTRFVDSGDQKSNNNVYKLAVMLFSMRSSAFQQLYLTDDNPWKMKLIDDEGKCLIPGGRESDYWSKYQFCTAGANGNLDGSNSPYNFWIQNDQWTSLEALGNFTEEKWNYQVNRHIFTYKSDKNMLQDYMTPSLDTTTKDYKFSKFKEFMEQKMPDKGGKATPSDAVHYILGLDDVEEIEPITTDLKVLDIEPCYDSKYGYSHTQTYFRVMIPDYFGKVTIRHMTTAEFIGSAEDLNSTYDMIFMGLDDGAYTLKWDGTTDWHDNDMDGKIYFHTGDSMFSGTVDNLSSDGRSRSVQFLWSEDKKQPVTGTSLRFPGNDITKLKQKELNEYLNAGLPVVAVAYLYDLDHTRIDQYSNIYHFIKESKDKGMSLYRVTDQKALCNAIKAVRPEITFTEMPKKYNGTAEIKTNNSKEELTFPKAEYLERDNAYRSILRFRYSVKDSSDKKYGCHVYLDQNQDGKFDNDELFYTGDVFTADDGEQVVTCKLSQMFFGLIQWKIEVYRVDNPNIHFVQTGCSVADNKTNAKRTVKVLQIMPSDDSSKPGSLDLTKNEHFKKYIEKLPDYEIKIKVITADTFMADFTEEHPFIFDYSKDTDYEEGVCKNNPKQLSEKQKELYGYDMFIIGFGDTYDKKNIVNTYGAVDFLKFFAACGKSILFTHDLTSMHNTNSNDFGYSANTLLRDMMGMNRYKAVSNQLSVSERKKLLDYQNAVVSGSAVVSDSAVNLHPYDTVTDVKGDSLEEKHGFTYYAMKRLGWQNTTDKGKMPYRYLIDSSKTGEPICPVGNAKDTGFNNNNDLTKRVTQTNQGQITEYPFKIDPEFTIAKTHGQWYQLNMEDPEVTVWYCLADNENGNPCAWDKTDDNGDGTGATYGVSPNDAANNYYIYSKGNIFYSGVGHSTVDSDMEAKLFINTMIAAYRAIYQPPMVEILNPEAELDSIDEDNNMKYSLSYQQEYNVGETAESETDQEGDIYFSPVEVNAISTKLDCSIYYEKADGTKQYITEIYDKKTKEKISCLDTNGNPLAKDSDGNWLFTDLGNMKEYYFKYPEKYLNEWTSSDGSKQKALRKIQFKISSNKAKKSGYTTLDMSVQALFQLD